MSVLNVTGLVCGRFDPLDSSPSNTLYSIGTIYIYLQYNKYIEVLWIRHDLFRIQIQLRLF